MQHFNQEQLEKEYDAENFRLDINGSYGIPELCELVDYLKEQKAKTVQTQFKVGDHVQRIGYSYEHGEVLKVDVFIHDDGEPLITYTIDRVGEHWESGIEPFNKKISHEYPW